MKNSEYYKCQCEEDGTCSKDECINASLNIECDKNCVEKCENVVFRNTDVDESLEEILYTKTTNGKGTGLFTGAKILPNQFIIEYIGEVLSPHQFKERMDAAKENSESNFYYAKMGNNYIDAKKYGNLARFLNHSCSPNARLELWTTYDEKFGEQLRLALFSTRQIEADEEICFDYAWMSSTECCCGSTNCSKFI